LDISVASPSFCGGCPHRSFANAVADADGDGKTFGLIAPPTTTKAVVGATATVVIAINARRRSAEDAEERAGTTTGMVLLSRTVLFCWTVLVFGYDV
jgi:TPP-dependent indolepyruvate ferredoxin oxidoreductase alpha subunit